MTGRQGTTPHAGVPACWSWPATRPGRDDVHRRFWDGIDTTGYSEKAVELLQEAADALDTDSATLTTWQADRCAVCGETGRRLVIDHDHATGLVRGWLCISCNTREGAAVGPGTVFARYRERPPTAILGLTIRYRDPRTSRCADPAPPRVDGWDDNAAAGLTCPADGIGTAPSPTRRRTAARPPTPYSPASPRDAGQPRGRPGSRLGQTRYQNACGRRL